MRCPSCYRPVDHEAESCYSCGFSSGRAMEQFGSNYVRMKRVHDAANCLRMEDLEEIERAFERLETRFPQLLFAVYLGELGPTISLGELGFWLLNHSRVEGAEVSRSNDHAILLIMDVDRQQAGLSLGYLSELLLTEEDCYRALMIGRGFLVNGEYGEGVVRIFRRLEQVLVKRAQKMKRLGREEVRALLAERGMNTLPLPSHVGAFEPGARARMFEEPSVVGEPRC